MTYSVIGVRCNPLNRGTLSFLVCMALPLLFPLILSHLSLYLWAVLLLQLIILTEFIISFFNQGADILGIKLFQIKPKQD